MPNESLFIEIDGEEATDLYDDVVALEVELSDEQPATFRLCISLARQPDDGAWSYQDEQRFRIWKPVTIGIGFVDSGHEDLISGFITRVVPRFTEDEGQSLLEISGSDASVLMDREEKLRPWPNMKDSDIASAILGEYPFTPDVEDTDVVHEEAVSTVMQRETDLRFLRRLARRNGFDCYMEGTTAHFRRVPVDSEPQPILAAHFGEETNLICFSATVDALRPTRVRMFQVDRLTGDVLDSTAESASDAPLGELDAAALQPAGSPATPTVYVANNAVTSRAEMDALCQQLFNEGSSFVTGEGEVDAAAYAHVLMPRALVTIKGVGESYSGVYYVASVRHAITRDGYTQFFRVTRDALMPSGDEQFAASGGGLL
jgi:phage protein D